MTGKKNSKTRRLFIAVPVKNEVTAALTDIHRRLTAYSDVLKVVHLDNYHITLNFIGNVMEDTCAAIVEAFKELEIQRRPLPFTLKGLGAFPDTRRINIIWAGIQTDIAAMNALNRTIEDFTCAYGIKPENRKFKPHLTMARARRKARVNREIRDLVLQHHDTEFIISNFNEIILYESILHRKGPEYKKIVRIPLE